jgi:replicative DNA helicase
MIDTKQNELALLAWMCMGNTFAEVPECYFNGQRTKGLYQKLSAQYRKTGEIEPVVYSEVYGDVIDQSNDVSFPKSSAPIIDALAQAYKANSAWMIAHRAIKQIESGEPIDSILKDSAKELADLSMQNTNETEYDHARSVFAFGDSVEKAAKSPVAQKGISCGIADLDAILNGFIAGYTYIIGGLKKTGKSRFALALMSNFLKNGNSGIFFSLEMKSPQVHGCIISNRAMINTGKYGTNKISNDELFKFSKVMSEYMQDNMVLSEKSGITPTYVQALIRKTKIKMPVKWVVVDYIQRMRASYKTESRAKEVESIITELSDIARDEMVSMIVLTQLSGEAEKDIGKSGRPVYSYVKESQAIIEACDAAIILTDKNRGQEFDAAKESKELSAVILQRDGVSDIWVSIDAELQYSKFTSISRGDF